MVTYGRFRETGRTERFYFINTHLDHISEAARLQGARMIREFFFPLSLPLILVGDFNESPDEAVYRELIHGTAPLRIPGGLHPRKRRPPPSTNSMAGPGAAGSTGF